MPLCKDLIERTNGLAKTGEYVIGTTVIGQGTTSVVKQAIHTDSQKTVAAKIMNLFLYNNIYEQELNALTHLRHENIVLMVDHCLSTEKNAGCIFLEYLPFPSLFRHLQTKGRMKEDKAWLVLEQIVSAFTYMHERGFSHNDFKPENVSYDEENNKIKILDFGLSQQTPLIHTNYGSPLYMAPEVHTSQHYSPQCSDVWSIGVTFYEMLTGDVPWADCEDQDELLDRLIFEEETNLFVYPDYLSEETLNILNQILIKDPQKRITSQKLHFELSTRKGFF
eukprot:TRINITY_DN3197_c0_g1_i1.p1 TRINITY_DN3197_c0_g1~~TRINITY_DN3197_c0_g1_i1.p1  ORF type:complete len:279 (+),score=49.46 TRINITY_DN3197_c0_g1_i1:123-959(+)